MLSGMLAAEHVTEALSEGRAHDEIASFDEAWSESDIGRDLWRVRNAKPLWSKLGTILGIAAGGFDMRSGQVRGIAVTGLQREPVAPELPTVAETIPGYEVSSWHALLVPAKTPSEIVKTMTADTIAAVNDPIVKRKLEEAGYTAVGSTEAELRELIKVEIDKWGAVIKTAGIKQID